MPKSKKAKPIPVDVPVKNETAIGSTLKATIFHDSVIKLRSPDFPDEEYLEVDLYDYFERLNRQGWSCVKVKKT